MAESFGAHALALGAVLVLGGTAADAQQPQGPAPHIAAVAPAQPLLFNPPLGQPLILRMSDSRLLPNGMRVEFAIEHRVEFMRGDGGLLASIEQISTQCSGSPPACAAFQSLSAPQMHLVRRFAVSAQGDVRLLTPAPPVHSGAAHIVAQLEQQSPGSVINAELEEALFFIGQMLPASGQVQESEIFGGDEPGRAPILSPLERRKVSHIDRTTGLVTHSVQTIQETAGAQRLLSERVWTLAPSPPSAPQSAPQSAPPAAPHPQP